MKKRIERLEKQMPEPDIKNKLISLCQKWYDAFWDGDFKTALQAREDADPLFELAPQWLEKTPYCRKVLYMHWDWFTRYKNPDVQDLIKEAVELNRWPGSLARPEDFELTIK